MIERYSTPEMRKIWDVKNKTQKWLDVELAVCSALAKNGLIPSEANDDIQKNAKFDINRMAVLELETRHDVMAFVRNVSENIGSSSKYLHFGITSYDVVDSALSMLLKESLELIIAKARSLLKVISRRAREEANTPMIGRTHGVHAEPITFGYKLAGWHAELERDIQRLESALKSVSVGKISGAVGSHANISPEIEKMVCQKLSLEVDPISTQIINRDRHAEMMCSLAILAAGLERWATEIRNLQRTEILEVQEAFAEGQTGSSAMPHKRNPWNCETVAGLARIVRTNSLAMLECVATWHERDLTNSGVERVIIPDTLMLIDWMLDKFTNILVNLEIRRENMAANLEKMRGLVFSEQIMLLLISKGKSREEAYKIAQRNAAKAWEGKEYKDALVSDEEVTGVLSNEEIESAFDMKHHLRFIESTLQARGI